MIARWITPHGPKPDNYYFLARKTFLVSDPPPRAALRITADSYYAVYLNDRLVGNGPIRGSHRRYFLDSYDLTAFLQPGPNWIAVEVHSPVRPTFKAVPVAPALLAEIDGLVATDASWQVLPDPAHRTDASLYTTQIGFSEWRDLTAELIGWRTGRDGDTPWQSAEEISSDETLAGRVLTPRPIPPLTSEVFAPVRLVGAGYVPDAGDQVNSPSCSELMTVEPHVPCPAQLENGFSTILPPPGNQGVYLILDFGRELFGHLAFDLDASAGTVMDVAHDELLQDDRLLPRRGDYRFADRFVLRAGRQTIDQRLHTRGLRYLQIVLRNIQSPIHIHAIQMTQRVNSQPSAAAFACDNAFFDRLWDVCLNTVRLCSADTFMDCPWREQAFWINDFAVVNLYYLQITGDRVYSAHNLRLVADAAAADGRIPAVYPCPPDPALRFPMMAASVTVNLYDYYLYTGDLNLVREILPVLEKALAFYDAWQAADGLIPNQPGVWNFIDWAWHLRDFELGGIAAPLNLFIAGAYRRAAALEEAVGNHAAAQDYTRRSQTLLAALNRLFWDSEKGFFLDCTEPVKGPAKTYSQHSLAFGLYFDLLTEPQKTRALENLLHPDLIPAQFLTQYYVLDILARHGRGDDIRRILENLWQPMIDAGTDTIWETPSRRSDFGNCSSLCHAFSCAPIHVFQTAVLGVRPLTPGFREFALNPVPATLQHAAGKVPTPHGIIAIQWTRNEDNKLAITLSVPPGTRAKTPDHKTWNPGTHHLILEPLV